MIDFRRQFLLLVLFALSVFVGASLARAETIPADSVPTLNGGEWYLNGQWAATRELLCPPNVPGKMPVWQTTDSAWHCKGTLAPYVGVDWGTFSARCVGGTGSWSGSTYTCSIPGYGCPSGQNWTLSGSTCSRPDCLPSETRNPVTGICEVTACTDKGPAAPDAYYDYGANPGGTFPAAVCIGGCLAIFSGTSPAASAVVNGVKHYFAFGGYDFAGSGASSSCTAGAETPAAGTALAEVPVSHCAPDQIEGLINGKLNCWNVPGSGVAPESAPTDAPVTTESVATTTTETVGDTTTTTNITNNSGGGQTTVVTACTAGNCTTTTTETKPATDPTEDSESEGSPVAGSLGAVGELAQAETRTFESVWLARKAEIMATPLIGLASSLTSFPGGVGVCPSWSVSGSVFGQSIAGDISPPCWIWDVLRAFMLITTLFSARRLIFGG